MTYFRLNPECYLIDQKNRGLIYDLITNKIYSLNSNELFLISKAGKNEPIKDNDFFNELKDLNLGKYYDTPIYIQKIRIGNFLEEDNSTFSINRAFIELNNECDNNCDFCGYNGIKREQGCISCNKWNKNLNYLNLDKIKEFIDDIQKLSCKTIYLTGADLTKNFEKTLKIIDYVNNKFETIFIILQSEKINKSLLNKIQNNVHILVQTNINSLNKIEIKSHNHTYIVNLKLKDKAEFENINEKLRLKYVFNFQIEKEDLIQNSNKNNVLKVNREAFFHNLEFHPCLSKTLTLTYNGDVLICPMKRSLALGNLKNNSLNQIISEKYDILNKIWRITLDEIEPCKACEFRYFCSDCRTLEEEWSSEKTKKYCKYNLIEN